MTDIEAIWNALRARLVTETEGFTTITRSFAVQYGVEQYPVLEILEEDETPTQDEADLAPLWVITGSLGIRVRSADESVSPWSQLNTLLRAVRTALERQPTDTGPGGYQHWTNLGGLVHALSIGRVEKSLGESSGEAWAKMAIEFSTF